MKFLKWLVELIEVEEGYTTRLNIFLSRVMWFDYGIILGLMAITPMPPGR